MAKIKWCIKAHTFKCEIDEQYCEVKKSYVYFSICTVNFHKNRDLNLSPKLIFSPFNFCHHWEWCTVCYNMVLPKPSAPIQWSNCPWLGQIWKFTSVLSPPTPHCKHNTKLETASWGKSRLKQEASILWAIFSTSGCLPEGHSELAELCKMQRAGSLLWLHILYLTV